MSPAEPPLIPKPLAGDGGGFCCSGPTSRVGLTALLHDTLCDWKQRNDVISECSRCGHRVVPLDLADLCVAELQARDMARSRVSAPSATCSGGLPFGDGGEALGRDAVPPVDGCSPWSRQSCSGSRAITPPGADPSLLAGRGATVPVVFAYSVEFAGFTYERTNQDTWVVTAHWQAKFVKDQGNRS